MWDGLGTRRRLVSVANRHAYSCEGVVKSFRIPPDALRNRLSLDVRDDRNRIYPAVSTS